MTGFGAGGSGGNAFRDFTSLGGRFETRFDYLGCRCAPWPLPKVYRKSVYDPYIFGVTIPLPDSPMLGPRSSYERALKLLLSKTSS